EVLTVQLTAENPFFLIASDGVFEFLSSQAVVNMVSDLIVTVWAEYVQSSDYRLLYVIVKPHWWSYGSIFPVICLYNTFF
ncbi:hypothetical protein, partial [Mycobacterium tuberculosis]